MNGGYSSYGAGMNSFGPGAGNIMEPGASVWMGKTTVTCKKFTNMHYKISP